MKTNDGYLEYSLGAGVAIAVGQTLQRQRLRQGSVANDDAAASSAVAVKKVINHASGLALGGHARKGGRRSSRGKCILLRLLVRPADGGGIVVGCGLGSDMRLLGNIKVGMKASKYINTNKQQTTRRKNKNKTLGGNTKKIVTATVEDADDGR